TEALPPVVAAAVGGVACAWLLAPLVGPALNLGVFDGTGPPIVVAPAVYPLAASATGLLLAALLVLALQAAITYQRGSARALLDSATARDVFAALQTANTELGVTVLVVTHDPAVSSPVRRTIAIRDGKT